MKCVQFAYRLRNVPPRTNDMKDKIEFRIQLADQLFHIQDRIARQYAVVTGGLPASRGELQFAGLRWRDCVAAFARTGSCSIGEYYKARKRKAPEES
jgi:hypothetical protein